MLRVNVKLYRKFKTNFLAKMFKEIYIFKFFQK